MRLVPIGEAFWGWIVLNFFLIFGVFQDRCSYKFVLIKIILHCVKSCNTTFRLQKKSVDMVRRQFLILHFLIRFFLTFTIGISVLDNASHEKMSWNRRDSVFEKFFFSAFCSTPAKKKSIGVKRWINYYTATSPLSWHCFAPLYVSITPLFSRKE